MSVGSVFSDIFLDLIISHAKILSLLVDVPVVLKDAIFLDWEIEPFAIGVVYSIFKPLEDVILPLGINRISLSPV